MNDILTFKFIKDWSELSAQHFYNKIRNVPEILNNLRILIEKFRKREIEDEDYNPDAYPEIFSYGFQFIYGALIKGLLIILTSLLFNTLIPTLVATCSFGIIRVFAGGLHFKSYTKCTWVSLGILLLTGLLGKYIHLPFFINILIFIFTLVMFILFAPVENSNRPFRNDDERVKFKRISIMNLIFLFILYNIISTYMVISQSIIYGVLMAGTIVLPTISKIE